MEGKKTQLKPTAVPQVTRRNESSESRDGIKRHPFPRACKLLINFAFCLLAFLIGSLIGRYAINNDKSALIPPSILNSTVLVCHFQDLGVGLHLKYLDGVLSVTGIDQMKQEEGRMKRPPLDLKLLRHGEVGNCASGSHHGTKLGKIVFVTNTTVISSRLRVSGSLKGRVVAAVHPETLSAKDCCIIGLSRKVGE